MKYLQIPSRPLALCLSAHPLADAVLERAPMDDREQAKRFLAETDAVPETTTRLSKPPAAVGCATCARTAARKIVVVNRIR